MPGLNKEIWVSEILEQHTNKANFLSVTEDMTAFVKNNKINRAEAGLRPNVIRNNKKYPVPVTERDDTALETTLHTFDTEATHLPRAKSVELSYDKMKSVVKGHSDALEDDEAQYAARMFSPTRDANFTPLLKTTGSNSGQGFAEMTTKDILTLATAFDMMGVKGKRTMVLHPTHFNQLVGNSSVVKAQMEKLSVGEVPLILANIYGFDIIKFKNEMLYDVSGINPSRLPEGTLADANKGVASFAFINNEMSHANGDMHMFETLNDATYKGDLISFQHRFMADPKRDKYFASIVSAKSS